MMSRDEALAEARRRWGKDAEVTTEFIPAYQRTFTVVGYHSSTGFKEQGIGRTPRDAFKDADRRAPSGAGSGEAKP